MEQSSNRHGICRTERIIVPLRLKYQLPMTYEEYLRQEQIAQDEEQADNACFLTNQPEGQFVRGH